MTAPDISIIVTAHREGAILRPTLISAERAAGVARAAGHSCEMLVVLDRADEATRAYAGSLPEWKAFDVAYGDPGQARNAGIAAARGRMAAMLDGDDLWSENWLAAAMAAANARPNEAIAWHPAYNVYFGGERLVIPHPDMEEPGFDLARLAFGNLWTVLVFTERRILVDTPYPPTDFSRLTAFEDWSWNLETIRRGVIHKIVSGTGHGIRVKAQRDSVVQRTQALGAMPAPTLLFREKRWPQKA